jgi:hypothetical protein
MVIEDYKKINWLDFKKDFTVIKVFSDEECDKIIDSIDKNVDKLKLSKENGWLYLSAYEMNVKELSTEVQEIVKNVISNFGDLNLNQSFVIKYNQNLISKMPGHYDGTYLSVPINLNNDFEGGGTYLPFLNYEHIPQNHPRGSGVIFKADTLKSWHEALPVTKGNRYVLVLKFTKKINIFLFLLKVLKILVAAKFVETFNKRYKRKIPH